MAITISTALATYAADHGYNSAFDTNGILEFHDGQRPTTADTTATGTNTLASITLPANVFIDPSVAGVMTKNGVWATSAAAANGNATWFRFKLTTDSGTTGTGDIRLDGNVGTSGADMTMSTTAVTQGSPITVNTFTATVPKS